MNNWLQRIKQGKCIHKSHNGIYVYENKRYRWVLFNERFIQSLMDRKNPKKTVIPYLNTLRLFQNSHPGNTCLLGLGAGSLVHQLLHPEYQLDIVEILPDMINVAVNFFYLPQSPQVKIHCQCANYFLQNHPEKFFHIIVDLGNENGFPEQLKHIDFFKNIYQRLHTNGFLAFNLCQFHDINVFKPLFKEIFGYYPLVIEVDGNWLLFARKNQNKQSLVDFLQKKYYLKSLIWHPNYGEIAHLNAPWVQKSKDLLHSFRWKCKNIIKKAH